MTVLAATTRWPKSRWLAFRLASLLLTLMGLLLITFLLSHFAPIDPVLQMAGDHASEATYAQVRQELGLHQSLPVQFWHYLVHLAHGDMGLSHTTAQPVSGDLLRTFPATLELSTLAMLLSATGGIVLALLAVLKPGGWLDNLVRLISLLGYSVPIFWLGLLGLLLFYAVLHWHAGPGQLDDTYLYTLDRPTGLLLVDSWLSGDKTVFLNALKHIWLPVVILGLLSMASVTRLLRAALLEEANKEYVTLARAKGVGRIRLLRYHVFPNVLPRLVTVLSISYTSLLEGAILTETVFAWPGIGRYLTNALFAADTPAILGATLVIGLCFVVLNSAADMLTHFLDPRTR